MRVRTSGALVGPFEILSMISKNTGTFQDCYQTPSASASIGTRSTMEDLNNAPAFMLGGVVNSPCKRTRVTRTGNPTETQVASVRNINNTVGTVTVKGPFAGHVLSGVAPCQVSLGSAGSRSLISAYAKMNRSDIISGEALATMRQTADMIRRPLAGLQDVIGKLFTKFYRQKAKFRRQKVKRDRKIKRNRSLDGPTRAMYLHQSLATFNRAVSDAYLEIRYGMFPFMWDTEGLIDLFVQEYFTPDNNLPAIIKVARGESFRAEDAQSGSFSPSFPYLNGMEDPLALFSSKTTKQISAGVVYEVKPSCTLDRVSAALGTRLRDIPSTLWELLPLSFVVDWAVNVGDWLQAVVPVPNIRPLSNWTTTVTNEERRIESISFHVVFGWGKPERRDFTFSGASEVVHTYERIVDNSLSSHPMITGKPLSGLRIADAAALSAQRVAGVLKSHLRH